MSLGGQHQRVNGGMAVQLCATFEEDSLARGTATEGARERVELLRKGVLPPLYARGLASTTWPGRSQVRTHARMHSALSPVANQGPHALALMGSTLSGGGAAGGE